MSQPVETQPKRTGYPIAAGSFTIVSPCLLIVSNSVLIFSYRGVPSDVFWIELLSFAVSIMLSVLSLLGGVQALAKKRLLLAVFGTSILIPTSLSNVTFGLSALANVLTRENFTISVYTVPIFTFSSVVLVL